MTHKIRVTFKDGTYMVKVFDKECQAYNYRNHVEKMEGVERAVFMDQLEK